jgi:heavy metal efflux system protein
MSNARCGIFWATNSGRAVTLSRPSAHTVLHNLVFGCALVFLIQWIFLGDLRSAIIVGVNIPFPLVFAVIMLVLMGEDANLLSVGAVDFGIIVDSAVILVENVFRNFQMPLGERQAALGHLADETWGADPTRERTGAFSVWTDRLRLIMVSAL